MGLVARLWLGGAQMYFATHSGGPHFFGSNRMPELFQACFNYCFYQSLAMTSEKKSLYASTDELQILIKQVLSWDIRSVSQRNQTQNSHIKVGNGKAIDYTPNSYDYQDEAFDHERERVSLPSRDTVYHLILEGLDVSYRIDCDGNVVVESVTLSSDIPNKNQNRCNYMIWRDKLG
ncbi:hypothetical protein L1049_023142 [Liquidambar formosana]|uniref:Uncharacterized protein n=1 Tax=Liquidambar formosana TaxID=63359 RepID=A0AAP0RDJ1_LIQFO